MPKITRGTVVVSRVPQGGTFKIRPVVVVQNDRNNARLSNVIAAMITSNTRLATKEPTQVLIEMSDPANKQVGLLHTSAVKCENLYTLPLASVRPIGTMPSVRMEEINAALMESLELS